MWSRPETWRIILSQSDLQNRGVKSNTTQQAPAKLTRQCVSQSAVLNGPDSAGKVIAGPEDDGAGGVEVQRHDGRIAPSQG